MSSQDMCPKGQATHRTQTCFRDSNPATTRTTEMVLVATHHRRIDNLAVDKATEWIRTKHGPVFPSSIGNTNTRVSYSGSNHVY